MATLYCDFPVNPDAPLLAGRFRLTRCIGGGSQGVAFVGRDLHDEHDELGVVVKMFDPVGRTMDECLAEARILAGLRSPHIVKARGVGFEDGTPWIVYEHIDGPAVQTHRQAAPSGRLLPLEAARIALGVLAALEECHARGVVHGSPHQNNVMLRHGVEPVLIDFGRVLPIGATDKATPTRDVAEAGQLLATMLTGYTSNIADQSDRLLFLKSFARDKLAALRIDGELAGIALRAMEPAPALRYQDAGEMRRALEVWLEKARARHSKHETI